MRPERRASDSIPLMICASDFSSHAGQVAQLAFPGGLF
jgi:hypothetical protein